MAGNGLCYRLMDQLVTFETAHEKCSQMDAHLLTIENQAESDFVNNWLMTETSKLQQLILP